MGSEYLPSPILFLYVQPLLLSISSSPDPSPDPTPEPSQMPSPTQLSPASRNSSLLRPRANVRTKLPDEIQGKGSRYRCTPCLYQALLLSERSHLPSAHPFRIYQQRSSYSPQKSQLNHTRPSRCRHSSCSRSRLSMKCTCQRLQQPLSCLEKASHEYMYRGSPLG